MKKKTLFIQVDGYENSNSVGGFWIFYYMHHGLQIAFDKICEGNHQGGKAIGGIKVSLKSLCISDNSTRSFYWYLWIEGMSWKAS